MFVVKNVWICNERKNIKNKKIKKGIKIKKKKRKYVKIGKKICL